MPTIGKSTIVLLTVHLICGLCSGAPAKSSEGGIANLGAKLEARCQEPDTADNTVTPADLEKAFMETYSWTEEDLRSFRDKDVVSRLVTDFALIPMARFSVLIGHSSSGSDPEIHDKYIKRLHKFYCRFRPIYMGVRGSVRAKDPKTKDLVNSAAELDVDDRKPLTKRLVLDALIEYEAYKNKIDELVFHYDIFSRADDLENYLHYMNRGELNALVDTFFSHVNEIKTKSDLLNLKDQFLSSLKENNLQVHQGKLYTIK